jgi:hypothetical protein
MLFPMLCSVSCFVSFPFAHAFQTPPARTAPARPASGNAVQNKTVSGKPPGKAAQGKPPANPPSHSGAATSSVLPPASPPAPPPTVFGPPLPLPPTHPRRAALVGGLNAALQATAARVDVDAAAFIGTLPALWRGTVYRPFAPVTGTAGTSPITLDAPLNQLRKSSGATLARINPLAAPGVVTRSTDDLPIVLWDRVDAALKQAAEKGQDVIFDIQADAGGTETNANTLIGATLRRYRADPPAPIVRWELACDASQAPGRYPVFARLARALAPDAALGLNVVSGNVVEGVRKTATICAQDKLVLDSVAWRVPIGVPDAGELIRRLRLALARFPALKNTLLLPTLPTLPPDETSGEPPSPAALVSLYARLVQAAPPDPPNPLLGALAENGLLESVFHGAATTMNTVNAPALLVSSGAHTLALLNRMAGSRLQTHSEDTGIGCLAVRLQARVLVLLWREPRANRIASTASRINESVDALTVLRLHNLPPDTENGLRILRYDPGDAPALSPPAEPGKPPFASATGLPPLLVADVPGGGNYLPGELEVPMLLEPGGACLLEILPAKPASSGLQLSLESTSANVRGGDPLEVILSVRNTTTKPRNLDIVLTASLPGVLPQPVSRVSPGVIAPNDGRAFRFTLRAPIAGANSNVALNVQANGDTAASLMLPILPAFDVALETPRADVETGSGAARMRVRLTNRSRSSLKLRLRSAVIDQANGTDSAPGTFVTLPPNSAPVISSITLSSPVHEPGVYPVTVWVEADDRLLRTIRAFVGVPFLCPYAVVKPTIDGDLSEWTEGEPLGMGRVEQAHGKNGRPWGGPGDISAYAYTRWDEQYFYFACAVTDDVFYQPYGLADMAKGDSVVFALATNSGLSARKSGEPEYAEFGMALLKDKQGHLTPTLARFLESGAVKRAAPVSVKGARFAIRQAGTRTFYEAAIPWSAWRPVSPRAGQTVSLAILVNDNDGQGRGYMEWGSGLAGSKRPALFPPLRLVAPPHD